MTTAEKKRERKREFPIITCRSCDKTNLILYRKIKIKNVTESHKGLANTLTKKQT